MARRLLLEGDDIDELLRRVRADHGQEARIVGAEEKLVGGLGGFFAKRRYEVAVALDDDDNQDGRPDALGPRAAVGDDGAALEGRVLDGRIVDSPPPAGRRSAGPDGDGDRTDAYRADTDRTDTHRADAYRADAYRADTYRADADRTDTYTAHAGTGDMHIGRNGPLDRSDVTPRNGVQLDLASSPGQGGHVGTRRALPADGARRRPRPITSLEDLMEAAGQLDGGAAAQPETAQPPAPFEPADYRRGGAPRHAAGADADTAGSADSHVFDDLMHDLASRSESDTSRPQRTSEPAPRTRRSRHAASHDANPVHESPDSAVLPQSIADVLDAVAGPERVTEASAARTWQPQPAAAPVAATPPATGVTPPAPTATPPAPAATQPQQPAVLEAAAAPQPPAGERAHQPAHASAAPAYASTGQAHASVAPAYAAAQPVSPLVALGMPAPQADPRIALLDVLGGVAVTAPQALTGVHVVVGDAAAIRQLAATWLRHCASDESALLMLAPAGSVEGDAVAAVRAGLPAALDLDGGALVLVDAGPSRAQARRAARQVEAVRALVEESGMSAAGVGVTVTAVLDARWDVETTRDWLGALTYCGTPLDDLGAHGVAESAMPLRLLAHGLRVSWLDAAPATLGAWAGPCLDRMLDAR